MTRSRLRVLKWWLKGHHNNVSFSQLLHFIAAPSYKTKAASVMENIAESDEYYIVKLRGLERRLYYPRAIGLEALTQNVVEVLYSDNWHYYEIPETKVGPDDIVADCGAAEGIFALTAEGRCRKLYLVEPLPVFVKALGRTFKDCGSVEILPCAVSDRPGAGMIANKGIASTLTEGDGQPVHVETLDGLFYEKGIALNYIKGDVEGCDFNVIAGARRSLREFRPKIAITTYHNPAHADSIREFIASVEPRYRFKVKGIYQETGSPVMLHAWCS